MKRGATKDEIIRATQDLITRNGIRAVRVDEIAQSLGISKRTLYELFTDKEDLVNTCLISMSHNCQRRISTDTLANEDPIKQLYVLTHAYIDDLYLVEGCFLSDIRRKTAFANQYEKHQNFWKQLLAQRFEHCLQTEEILAEVDPENFAEKLMKTLYELRLGTSSREELYLFCRTLLRGAATQKGIDRIDSMR